MGPIRVFTLEKHIPGKNILPTFNVGGKGGRHQQEQQMPEPPTEAVVDVLERIIAPKTHRGKIR
jgi:hypothetical protein